MLTRWFDFRFRFYSLNFHFVSSFIVDIIKPKPLPRNVINGNFTQANSSNNPSTNNSTETINTTTNSSVATTASDSNTTNTSNKSVISHTATPAVNTTTTTTTTSAVSKTESLIQRFSFSNSTNNGNTSKSPPEVMKRMNSKQIATIFEVRTNYRPPPTSIWNTSSCVLNLCAS